MGSREFKFSDATRDFDSFGNFSHQWPKGDLSWSGGDVVSLSLKDVTPPKIQSSTTLSTGVTILIKFDEPIDQGNLPPASAFTISVDGNAMPVPDVAPGAYWLFGFDQISPAIRQGQTVTITYTDPSEGDDANAFQDYFGNDAASVTFTVINGSLVQEDISNASATGVPTISGTPQVGQTLTASTSGIQDANGLTRVEYSYQWIAKTVPRTPTYPEQRKPATPWRRVTQARPSRCGCPSPTTHTT